MKNEKVWDEERELERLKNWKERCKPRKLSTEEFYECNPEDEKDWMDIISGLDKYLTKMNCKKLIEDWNKKLK